MIERRKHKRHLMPRGTLAILRSDLCERLRHHEKMSIGEIAMVLYKSESDMISEVADISFGGISFNGIFERHGDMQDCQLDLLMTEQGIYMHNIPYEPVPLLAGRRGGSQKGMTRTNALRFQRLNAKHKDQLRELLDYAVE